MTRCSPILQSNLMRDFLDRLDRSHRAFTVAATIWAISAPFWFDLDSCGTGPRRYVSKWIGHCSGFSTDLGVVFVACALPALFAYLAIFVIAPPVARWIADGDRPR